MGCAGSRVDVDQGDATQASTAGPSKTADHAGSGEQRPHSGSDGASDAGQDLFPRDVRRLKAVRESRARLQQLKLPDGEAKVLIWDSEWFDAMRLIAMGKRAPIARALPETYDELDWGTEESLIEQFNAVVQDRFGGPAASFWRGLLTAFIEASDDGQGLTRSGWKEMCTVVFAELGGVEEATGDSIDAFFTRADVNSNDSVSFPELVAVFELETVLHPELAQWIMGHTSKQTEQWLKKVARIP